MDGIQIDKFGGEAPRIGSQLLEPYQARQAINCLLMSGELRPLYVPDLFKSWTTTNSLRYAFRLPDDEDFGDLTAGLWAGFPQEKTSFLKGPLINDVYKRYYWTAYEENAEGDNDFRMQFLNRRRAVQLNNTDPTYLENGFDGGSFDVGVPKPKRPLSITPEIWCPPHWVPHYQRTTEAAIASIPGQGGEYAFDTVTKIWYMVGSNHGPVVSGPEFGSDGWWKLGTLAYTRKDTVADMVAIATVDKWDYVEVTDDPDPLRNGIYVASLDMGGGNPANARKYWKFAGQPARAVTIVRDPDTSALSVDAETNASKNAEFTRYTVNRLEDFYNFAGVGNFPYNENFEWRPVERLDYCWNIAVSEYDYALGKDTRYGHWWAQVDVRDSGTGGGYVGAGNKINLIDAAFPSHKTEVVTRAYVYTYVNVFGEEGPPSDPRSHDLLDGERWVLHNWDTDPELEGMPPVVAIRVYRSVTGLGGTTNFFFVCELPLRYDLKDYIDTWNAASPVPILSSTRYALRVASTEAALPDDDYIGRIAKVGLDPEGDRLDLPVYYRAYQKEGTELPDDYDFDQPTQVPVDWIIDDSILTGLEYTAGTGDWIYRVYDGFSDEDVSVNDLIESTGWTKPEKGLLGLVAHPSGFFVAYKDNDVHFSEPYRLHAWPNSYRLSVEHPIIGLGVFSQTIVVITEGHPYFITGVRPENLSKVKYDTPVPGTAFDGIVSFTGRVWYPTYDGIAQASSEGVHLITSPIITEEEWSLHNPYNQFAARDGSQYISFYAPTTEVDKDIGFILYPGEELMGFTHLRVSDMEMLADADMIQTDPFTGIAYILSNNTLYRWNPQDRATRIPTTYTWRSKDFVFPDPVNLGSFRVLWESDVDVSIPGANPNPMPNADPILRMRLYAGYDSEELYQKIHSQDGLDLLDPARSVTSKYATRASGKCPAGFKAEIYSVEFYGNVIVKNCKLAETGTTLKAI